MATVVDVWTARQRVSAAHRAWKASGQPVGSSEHAAYMHARIELDGAKDAARAAHEPAPAPPISLPCCARGAVSYGCTCVCVLRCAEHGEQHFGTHD